MQGTFRWGIPWGCSVLPVYRTGCGVAQLSLQVVYGQIEQRFEIATQGGPSFWQYLGVLWSVATYIAADVNAPVLASASTVALCACLLGNFGHRKGEWEGTDRNRFPPSRSVTWGPCKSDHKLPTSGNWGHLQGLLRTPVSK